MNDTRQSARTSEDFLYAQAPAENISPDSAN